MILILTVASLVFVLCVLGLLVWLIVSSFASRKDIASQSVGIGFLQQQIEALKAAQNETRDGLQKSLQTGQNNLSQNLQSSQKSVKPAKQSNR